VLILKIAIVVIVCSLSSGSVMADNQEIWNNAYNLGKHNQFNLNLNQNSTINSYGATHKFESSVIDNANAGASGANITYNAAHDDPNYLYNHGVAEIQNCKNKNDPRCSTLNKYGDEDTQRVIQAYTQGFSQKYYMSISSDPSASNCSIIHRKKPVNATNYKCNAGIEQHTQCHNLINVSADYIPASPVDGTIFQPSGSPGVCGVGVVTNSWIPQSDRAWFTISQNINMFASNTLPITMGATSGKTPCRGASGTIITYPTKSRVLVGQWYMDWLGGNRGNIGLYQEPGENCGIDDSTSICRISMTLSLVGGGTLASWVVNFARPIPQHYIQHYSYSKGCPDVK